MFPTDTLLAYVAACVLVILAPGPDNILAVSRGLSQGRLAAALSAAGAGIGILCHTLAATFGLALLIQASATAFWVVKAIGALYLLWLGGRALVAGNLVTLAPAARLPLRRVLATGILSNVLNPKPGLFVLAFVPQFCDAARGPVAAQMLVYGTIFAVMTAAIFTLLGGRAARLSAWLRSRPRAVRALNAGAGATFLAAGLSVLTLKQRASA
jgi:threonine/homoserine/homoserine lactone efflux protein